jgi:hypothetical protein
MAAQIAAPPTADPDQAPHSNQPGTPAPAGAVFYKNCGQARKAGAAPLHAGDPGYSATLDKDGDGVACEKNKD